MSAVNIDLGALSATNFGRHSHQYNQHDVALYAVALGCSADQLHLVYERHALFVTLPTFLCASVVQASFLIHLVDILPDYDQRQLLHGEMFTQFYGPLATLGSLVHTPQLINLSDKKAAVVVTAVRTTDGRGLPLAYTETTVFVRNTGRFTASTPVVHRHADAIAANSPPTRPPDFVASVPTRHEAAVLYRLASKDLNLLHVDPEVAAEAGFDRPILHGMATIGMAAQCLLQEFCKSDDATLGDGPKDAANCIDPLQLRSIKARFTGHVFPGETLAIEAWQELQGESHGESVAEAGPSSCSSGLPFRRVIFRVTTVERGTLVLSHAAIVIGAPMHVSSHL